MATYHAAALTKEELEFHIEIERKKIDAYMNDLKALTRKLVVMKYELRTYEKELLRRKDFH